MTPIRDTAAPPARPHPRAARALARSWREALIPLGAGDADAIPLLRALARRILTGWRIPAALVEDVVLAVSELATNALIHTDGPVRLRLSHRRGTVRLDVADTSAYRPEAADPGADAEHGRGLAIVAALADRMHTEPTPGNGTTGKLIVAEFDLS
jgi:anti-sigma regulatory factor (Ser/Thr protein kinase)